LTPGRQRPARLRASAFVLALVALSGCAGRRVPALADASAPSFGVYEATHRSAGGRRSFRVLLHAALPDRIHAEVVGPIGGPRLVVDGGDGRLAVTLVGERTSYVGPARPEALEAVLGVRIALDDLVAGLVTSRAPEGPYEFERSASPPGLPARVAVTSASGERLELRLKRLRPVASDATGLATGTPPPGTERRPLTELAGVDGAAWIAREPADGS
jgi:hypothetical protein